MDFAIVKFEEEEDAPGIIPTNWLTREKNACFYPKTSNEFKKTKLVLVRAKPESDWEKCSVRILKEFSDYKAARNALTEAEYTSNLDSDPDAEKIRKKKKKNIWLPGEISSSDDEVTKKSLKNKIKSRKTKFNEFFPLPFPSPPVNQDEQEKSIPMLEQSVSLLNLPIEQSKFNQLDAEKSRKEKNKAMCLQDEISSNSDEDTQGNLKNKIKSRKTNFNDILHLPFPSPPVCQNEKEKPISILEQSVSLIKSPIEQSKFNQLENEVAKCQGNQRVMWNVLSELLQITQSNSSKLDQLLVAVNNNQIPQSSLTEDENFLASLPCSYEEFLKLNEKILESFSFRKNLVQILMTAGGRDGKAMVNNCLRKLITDDAAEKFSLTGKHRLQIKEAFEKTQIYKLIIEACTRIHKDVKENILREGISDWLMQAKFRRNRREKRKHGDTDEVDELTFS